MKILVSACLLGKSCKYSGGSNKNERVIALGEKHQLVPVCPEYSAQLPIPRPPAEILGGRVFNNLGEDITEKFLDGAEKTLYIAEEYGCRIAVLKERSPSCGFGTIYDGTFSGKTVSGNGITAQLLYDNGIRIFGESQIDRLKKILEDEEQSYE